MEITKVFKACVKAAKVRNKNSSNNSILPKSKKKIHADNPPFNSKAIDVVNGITKFKKFLLEYKSEYLNENRHLSFGSSMSEEERDQIDDDAQSLIKSCSNAINNIKSETNQPNIKEDESNHKKVVVELIQAYHVEISKLYSQLRAFRVKQTIDMKKMSKLRPDHRSKTSKIAQPQIGTPQPSENEFKTTTLKKQTQTKEKTIDLLLMEERKPREEIQFTAEETQLFEEENDILYNQMNSLVKEIQNIEGKVIEIGQLQEIFHEKVLSQSEQIENIHGTAVSTTENVNEGNEEIREAIKNSATFRVWVLFFLVMCTFSLLFLDWYNP